MAFHRPFQINSGTFSSASPVCAARPLPSRSFSVKLVFQCLAVVDLTSILSAIPTLDPISIHTAANLLCI